MTWVTEYLRTSPFIQHLVSDIANGTVVAVCDGSYFKIHSIGSSAWILFSADGSSWIEGGGIVPGPISDLSSYRCELGGLLGIGIGSACLKNLLPARPHFILTACDNLEALRKNNSCSDKGQEFLEKCRFYLTNPRCLESTTLPAITQHAYDHQDDKRMGTLTIVESLNVHMDKLAKTLAI